MRQGGARRGDGWPGQHARGGTAGASHGRVYEAPHPRAKHVLAPLSDSERAAAGKQGSHRVPLSCNCELMVARRGRAGAFCPRG